MSKQAHEHTPGPYGLEAGPGGIPGHLHLKAKDGIVASVSVGGAPHHNMHIHRANARLLAAAPELLAALRELLVVANNHIRPRFRTRKDMDVFIKAKRAIALAETAEGE